jgi:16S rRNA (guanine966-N2)-methyltransferase
LPVVAADGLRPTPERVRETLFNWLRADIDGSRCLDLFAGTGALGFEALSRGAEAATFVEKSRTAVAGLQKSAALLGADSADIQCVDAMIYLSRASTLRYDIVFLDPPFAANLLEESCRLLQSNDWLAPGAKVYIECERRQSALALPAGWRATREKTAGNVRYQLLQTGAA